ncbi:MAG: hypothetical protein HQK81_10980 [Desulfovibrionaceae bacterium]|nr:hypothetical protein [Desulfovibrionaceae bacterium]MBF0514565.1 hypothetical protein [Desulfovibrionaceae bacterium]
MGDATKEPEEFQTTAAHFEAFQSEAKKWIGIFGLVGWMVEFDHMDLPGSHAECSTNYKARIARLRLAETWGEPPTEDRVRRSAFHEACELLFAPLYSNATDYELGTAQREVELEASQHSIIRTLENVVWEKEYNKITQIMEMFYAN